MKTNQIDIQEIQKRLEEAFQIIRDCKGCYRFCSINRFETTKTYCHTGINPRLVYYREAEDNRFFKEGKLLEFYFRHCNLRCVYCYDYDVHHNVKYKNENEEDFNLEKYYNILNDYFKYLNINQIKALRLINVDHLIPHNLYVISEIFNEYHDIPVPIIFDSNGFAYSNTLKFLRGLIHIYYTDFKFISNELARKYLKDEYYPNVAKETIKEMYYQVGDTEYSDYYIKKGLVVRLLIMPDLVEEYKTILDYLLSISKKIRIELLSNYTPAGLVPERSMYAEINKPTLKEQIQEVYNFAKYIGFSDVKII